ncbi:MAG: glycosyltransferase family 2 protein [Meiothermus sp.]
MRKKSVNPKITVFTPSYNRAKLLPRAYESLRRQSFKDFEWLIVDDGSADDTKTVVESWTDAPFPIRYVYKENGGKHTALNRGVQEAKGDFFVILDSDDWITDTTLERMIAVWDTVPDKNRFAEVVGLFAYEGGEVVGTRFPRDVLDSDPAEIQAVYKVWGDKLACHRTAVLREFPFPEDLGRFVTESLVWYRIARRYKSRFVNEIWAYKEFQAGGLTANTVQMRTRGIEATLAYYAEAAGLFLERRYPARTVLKSSANYVRFALHARVPIAQQLVRFPSSPLWLASLVPGTALFLADKYLRGQISSRVKINRPDVQNRQDLGR